MGFLVTFVPDNLTVEVAPGTSLRQAAAMAGIGLKSVCGGEGTCGMCLVKIQEGKPGAARLLGGNVAPKRRREGYVPACRTVVEGDLAVEVPDFSRLAQHRVLVEKLKSGEVLAEQEADLVGRFGVDPLLRRVTLRLDPPTLTENASDWTRLVAALRREAGLHNLTVGADLDVLARLPKAVRDGNWEITLWLRGWADATGGAQAAGVGGASSVIGGTIPGGGGTLSVARPAYLRPGNGSSEPAASDAPAKVQVIDLAPGRSEAPNLGLAIDIGTTSVVTDLVDLDRGTLIAARGTFNHQARYGDDVITRIIHATDTPNGLVELNQAVLEAINELIDGLCLATGFAAGDIREVSVAGNTTMEHLFLGLPPGHIRLEPYIPAAVEFPIVKAGDLGLKVNPVAPVRCVPSVASYVGGDITAGVLVTGVADRDEVSLFIDIGTNGEMVLGNREWMVSCACSAGPCFEGGGITHGMRAVPGAIERLDIGADYEVTVETVGGGEPKGICGSGLVDALAKLREAGIIDRAGKFHYVPSDRLREGSDGPEFVLVWGKSEKVAPLGEPGGRQQPRSESAMTTGAGQLAAVGEIVITEADVKNLIRAKGAVYAGIRSLLAAVDLDLAAVDRIYIAGGFGNYLNVKDAVRIGMLPDVDPARYRFVGNTSVKGARAALVSRAAFEYARELAMKMTYLELSAGRGFMEEFVSALFLPHTDLGQFPSVQG